jgi:hypothetical protein
MARYYFHIEDGKSYPDHEGVELPDIKAVRAEAIRASGEMLRDHGISLWDGEEWEMRVVDHAGEPVMTLKFSAAQHVAGELPAAA